MTIDEQLREIARHADQHQRVITADEIVRRASGSYLAPERRRGRHWVLAAAVVIVLVALGLLAVNVGEPPDHVRTDKVPSTSTPTIADIPPRLDRLRR